MISTAGFANVLLVVGILSLPIGSGLASAGAWWLATRRFGIAMAALLSVASFSLLDLAMFRSLPLLGLSFGSWRFPFLSMTAARGFAAVSAALLLMGYLGIMRWRNPGSILHRSSSLIWAAPISINLAMSGCVADGLFIEPLSIEVRHVSVTSDQWDTAAPSLRIVQISDTHVERLTGRERDVVQLVNDLDPDLILMTGDYLNISNLFDAQSREDFRNWAGQLHARYGTYAAWGNTDLPAWRDELFDGLDVTILEDEVTTLHINGQPIHLLGLDIHHHFIDKDRRALRHLAQDVPQEGFNILLYHTPDLMPEVAATNRFDLYLAGHTHGGQIRLPVYGALMTASKYGKRYEAGRYREGRTTLYVNRGLGFEGGLAPRVRFFCPPEITVITVSPET